MQYLKISTFSLSKRNLAAVAIALRLLLAPFLSHPFDMRIFMAVGKAVANGITPYGQYTLETMFSNVGHFHLYGTFSGIGYPPPWGLICGLMYSLSSVIAPDNLYAYVLALKVPIIVAEVAVAYLVYCILKPEIGEKNSSRIFLLFLFCPFILAVGTVWGMFDVLALLFALLSAYTLQSNWMKSSLFLSIASVLKVFPVVLVPLYSLFLYRSSKSAAAKFLVLTVGVSVFLALVPMAVFGWPVSNMYNALVYHFGPTNSPYSNQQSLPYGAASLFNSLDSLNWLTGEVSQLPTFVGYVWMVACIAVYVLFYHSSTKSTRAFDFRSIVQWSLLLMLAFFTTRVWVSEQNLVFLFAFFALSVFLHNPKESWRVTLLWLLLFAFVLVNVPVLSFLWVPYPWTLNAASSFADGPWGWTRLLSMTLLAVGWFALCWRYVIKLRWKT
jgi:hypothetical protein